MLVWMYAVCMHACMHACVCVVWCVCVCVHAGVYQCVLPLYGWMLVWLLPMHGWMHAWFQYVHIDVHMDVCRSVCWMYRRVFPSPWIQDHANRLWSLNKSDKRWKRRLSNILGNGMPLKQRLFMWRCPSECSHCLNSWKLLSYRDCPHLLSVL